MSDAAEAEPNAATAEPLIRPDDVHNRTLLSHVHPPEWTNPTPAGRYNLVAIGGGTAGLISAMATAGLGGRAALIEKHLLGGDCLNVGCVPSKALLSAAHAAHQARTGGPWGVSVTGEVKVDFPAIMERLRRIRAEISHHDSAARFRDAGVDVFIGEAKFVAPDAVEVGGQRLEFARCVIATGASPFVPPIPGVDEVGVRTNETIFELTELPKRLAVIGGGPIGCEMAQAFRRFGVEVTLIDMAPRILNNDDADAAQVVQDQLVAEGVGLVLGAKVGGFEAGADGKIVRYTVGDDAGQVVVDEILMSIGRRANVSGLGLDVAGVETTKHGVKVDDRLRATNKRVYAAGDVAGGYQFTHAADAHARIVVQNALFWGRKKVSDLVVPWATYTDPELAHVGLTAKELAARDDLTTLTIQLADNDRARCEGKMAGFARFHVDKKGRIAGATIVGDGAGELIAEVALAMTNKLGMGAIAGTIHAYPTRAEVVKRAADTHNRGRLTPFVAGLLKRILKWRR